VICKNNHTILVLKTKALKASLKDLLLTTLGGYASIKHYSSLKNIPLANVGKKRAGSSLPTLISYL
jgi:hypothetical protein